MTFNSVKHIEELTFTTTLVGQPSRYHRVYKVDALHVGQGDTHRCPLMRPFHTKFMLNIVAYWGFFFEWCVAYSWVHMITFRVMDNVTKCSNVLIFPPLSIDAIWNTNIKFYGTVDGSQHPHISSNLGSEITIKWLQMNRLSLRNNMLKFKLAIKKTDCFRWSYIIHPSLIKENLRSTCNRLDLQTLRSQPVMPKNLHDRCFQHNNNKWPLLMLTFFCTL